MTTHELRKDDRPKPGEVLVSDTAEQNAEAEVDL